MSCGLPGSAQIQISSHQNSTPFTREMQILAGNNNAAFLGYFCSTPFQIFHGADSSYKNCYMELSLGEFHYSAWEWIFRLMEMLRILSTSTCIDRVILKTWGHFL